MLCRDTSQVRGQLVRAGKTEWKQGSKKRTSNCCNRGQQKCCRMGENDGVAKSITVIRHLNWGIKWLLENIYCCTIANRLFVIKAFGKMQLHRCYGGAFSLHGILNSQFKTKNTSLTIAIFLGSFDKLWSDSELPPPCSAVPSKNCLTSTLSKRISWVQKLRQLL